MVNTHCLEAPWSLFDDVPAILAASEFQLVEKRRESIVKGVRRFDTAEFEVADESTHVTVWLERRLGDKAMFIMVVPGGRRSARNNDDSNRLAECVVKLLIQHGAFDNDVGLLIGYDLFYVFEPSPAKNFNADNHSICR